MIELSELLSPNRIVCQCNIRSKKRALQTLSELLAPSVCDKQIDENVEPELSEMDIFDALINRERLGSTALGHGVALPHSRLNKVEVPIAAMITLESGVDYEAPDEQPVDILIGLLVPEKCNDEHLKILANLAKSLNSQHFRQQLRDFNTNQAQALYDYLQKQAPAA